MHILGTMEIANTYTASAVRGIHLVANHPRGIVTLTQLQHIVCILQHVIHLVVLNGHLTLVLSLDSMEILVTKQAILDHCVVGSIVNGQADDVDAYLAADKGTAVDKEVVSIERAQHLGNLHRDFGAAQTVDE